MNNLIMGKRQDKILIEGIMNTEGHIILVVTAVDRIFFHVAEGIVHPAHVPFETEAETAGVGGP